MRITVNMPSFEGVAVGQTATCHLPIGRTYHSLFITYAGVTLAQMDEIRIVANGVNIQRWDSGTLLDVYNRFCGRAAAAGVLALDFDRPNMKTRDGEEFTKLGTGHPDDPTPITTLNVEIDINAGAAAPALSCRAIQSEPTKLGLIKLVRHYVYNPAAAGDFDISDLPKGNLIGRLIFNDTAAAINALQIQRDNRTVFERTTAENELIQTDGMRVPIANYWVYDPTELGYGSEALATAGVNDLRITATMAGAGALPLTVEYIGALTA